jgi:hypothetical protein
MNRKTAIWPSHCSFKRRRTSGIVQNRLVVGGRANYQSSSSNSKDDNLSPLDGAETTGQGVVVA